MRLMGKQPKQSTKFGSELLSVFVEEGLEARAGIEPAHKGFADLSLTTWVPRLGRAAFIADLVPNLPSQTGGRRREVGAGDEI